MGTNGSSQRASGHRSPRIVIAREDPAPSVGAAGISIPSRPRRRSTIRTRRSGRRLWRDVRVLRSMAGAREECAQRGSRETPIVSQRLRPLWSRPSCGMLRSRSALGAATPEIACERMRGVVRRGRYVTLVGCAMLAIAAVPAGTLKPCVGFESRLRVVPSVVASGETPRSAGVGETGLGWCSAARCPGWAADGSGRHLLQAGGAIGRRASSRGPQISDPGPISVADFFVLQPGARISVTLRSLVSLPGLGPGAYQAYAAIWTDPYLVASICRSGGARFRVE